MDDEKDPIEGFHITGYDPETRELTISIDPMILRHKSQEQPLTVKAVQIITQGPSVDSVKYVPRGESDG